MLKKFLKLILLLPQLIIREIFFFLEKILSLISIEFSFEGRDKLVSRIDNDIRNITHYYPNKKEINLKLFTPNKTCLFRQNTFSSKEPELLEWIDKFGGEGIFFDIGANIGIYSLYYALTKPGKVYSFEPSIFNLRQLGKNISINNLSNKIIIVPNALSQKTGTSLFVNSNTDEGGALNAFGVNYGFDGNKIDNLIEYSTLGFSLDELIYKNIIHDVPSLIKIDVDGIEHLVLSGAKETIKNKLCKSVFVEVNDNFEEQAKKVEKILLEAGFNLIKKTHSDEIEYSEEFSNTYNQIWVK